MYFVPYLCGNETKRTRKTEFQDGGKQVALISFDCSGHHNQTNMCVFTTRVAYMRSKPLFSTPDAWFCMYLRIVLKSACICIHMCNRGTETELDRGL